jgi:hypothetical protein
MVKAPADIMSTSGNTLRCGDLVTVVNKRRREEKERGVVEDDGTLPFIGAEGAVFKTEKQPVIKWG